MKWPTHIIHIHNCGFSTILIYSHICLIIFLASEYLWIFVAFSRFEYIGIFILRYLFCQFLAIQIYSDVNSNQFYDIRSSMGLLIQLSRLILSTSLTSLSEAPLLHCMVSRRQTAPLKLYSIYRKNMPCRQPSTLIAPTIGYGLEGWAGIRSGLATPTPRTLKTHL